MSVATNQKILQYVNAPYVDTVYILLFLLHSVRHWRDSVQMMIKIEFLKLLLTGRMTVKGKLEYSKITSKLSGVPKDL